MLVELIKHYNADDIDAEVHRLSTSYGTIEALSAKVAVSKCSSPHLQDELQLWRAIQTQHVEIRTTVAYEGTEKVSHFSPARMELLEAIRKHHPKSVRELALAAKRDYKNVYDDLASLEEAGLVEFLVEGRKSRPVCTATEIKLTLES